MDIVQKYYAASEQALEKVPHFIFMNPVSNADKEHIAEIGASVMMTRDEIMPGGSFVQSIVKNDLASAFALGDTVCQRAIKFFVYCNQHIHIK